MQLSIPLKNQLAFYLIITMLFCVISPVKIGAEEIDLTRYIDAVASRIAQSAIQKSGYVVYVRGNDIYFDVGANAGGKVGQEWEIVREISDIPHPLTGEIIGKSEQFVGKAMVNRVREKLALATPISPLTADQIKIGDRVYLASRLKKLAVMRLVGESAAITPFYSIMSEIFVNSLEKQPGLEILPPEEVENSLKKFEDIDLGAYNGFLGKKTVMKIGKLLGVDGIVLGNIFKSKGQYLINVRIVETKKSNTIQFFEKYIPETEGIKAFVSLKPAATSEKGEVNQKLVKIGEEDFEFKILGQSLSDVDLDNQPEIVILTDNQLKFFNWDGLFFNEERVLELKSQADIPLFSRRDLGNLVCVDLNRNRYPEIYFSQGNMTAGEMVEWDGKYFTKSSLTYYHPITAFKDEGSFHLVMGLYEGTRNYFNRESVKEISLGNSVSQVIDNKIRPPEDFYQIVNGDIDRDGKNEWILVDTEDRIKVYNRDFTPRWQSTPHFGTSLSLIDTDNDGQQEVVVSSRALPGEEDRFFVLRWDGIGLAKMLESPLLSGSICHISGSDLDGDNESEIIVSLSFAEAGAVNTRIQIYKLK